MLSLYELRRAVCRILVAGLQPVPRDANDFCDNGFDDVDDDNCRDIFVHDTKSGETKLVSVDSAGNQGNDESTVAGISADGRYVAFNSDASNLVRNDTNDNSDIFVHDLANGTTERANLSDFSEEANSWSGEFAISADGRFIAFLSAGSNLTAGDRNGEYDIFVRDRETRRTERVSEDRADIGMKGVDAGWLAISGDGLSVAYQSNVSNLVAGDTNDATDVFVYSVRAMGNDSSNKVTIPIVAAGIAVVVVGSGVWYASRRRKTSP